jgi:hypothetical protein
MTSITEVIGPLFEGSRSPPRSPNGKNRKNQTPEDEFDPSTFVKSDRWPNLVVLQLSYNGIERLDKCLVPFPPSLFFLLAFLFSFSFLVLFSFYGIYLIFSII